MAIEIVSWVGIVMILMTVAAIAMINGACMKQCNAIIRENKKPDIYRAMKKWQLVNPDRILLAFAILKHQAAAAAQLDIPNAPICTSRRFFDLTNS